LTIASTLSRISYVGDGSTTAFPVPFYFQANADIKVMLQSSTGVQTTLTLGTGYNLSGAGVTSGGTCTFPIAPTALTGAVISIFRDPLVTQTTSYNNNDPFPAKSHEGALDKLTTLEQRTRDMISRSLQLRDSDATVDMHLPANRQNKLLGFDGSNNPVAVFGPTFVGSTDVGAAIVSTKAVAAVTTFAGTVLYLVIGGTSTAGDTTQTTYIRGTGTGSFTDGGSVSWKPVPSPGQVITTFGVSVTGDGTTDDRAAMQAVINAVSAAGGGVIYGAPGKTYRCVINAAVTDIGLIMKAGVSLMLNTATINLECTGNVHGIRMQSNSAIVGGTVKTTLSTGLTSFQSIWHTPISIGYAYGGDGGAAGAPTAYTAPTGWLVKGLTLGNVRNDGAVAGGAHITIYGGANQGLIEDITILNSATVAAGIGMDWAPIGGIDSSNIPASATAFLAGTAYTLHPHDIEVRRINIGNMSTPNTGIFGSHGIRLSGVHNIRTEGVKIKGSTYAGIFHTAGDCGFEFAQASVKSFRYKGTKFKDVRIEAANNGWGVFCDCYADNVALAVGSGYSAMLPTQGETDILFENVQTYGSNSSSALPGFRMQNQQGGELRNCLARLHSVGVLAETDVDRLKIRSGVYDSNWTRGIHITSGNAAEDTLIDGAQCFSNGLGGGSTDSGICLGNSLRTTVQNCILGGVGGESFQDYGIRCDSTQDSIIINNYVLNVATSGVAYSIGSSTDYGFLAMFDGNRAASTVTTKMGGVNILPYAYTYDLAGDVVTKCRAASTVLSSNAPTAGTWKRGTIIEFTDPSAAGKLGVVCTASGAVGTWKPFGAIDA
jgi:hypothetical protein